VLLGFFDGLGMIEFEFMQELGSSFPLGMDQKLLAFEWPVFVKTERVERKLDIEEASVLLGLCIRGGRELGRETGWERGRELGREQGRGSGMEPGMEPG
jgi:hypothetical protein